LRLVELHDKEGLSPFSYN